MKNGFTLVELLAVIVILAIIALIATPIILNIIGDTKKESDKRSIEMYGDAIKNAVAKSELNGTEITPGDLSDELLSKVEYEGSKVECETHEIYSDGNIYLSECMVNDNPVEYTYGEKQYVQVYKPQYYWYGKTNHNVSTEFNEEKSQTPPVGLDYYIGLDLSDSNVVLAAYACFKKNGNEYCLKGADENSYEKNKEILKEAYGESACTLNDYYYCEKPPRFATARPNGDVTVNYGVDFCNVDASGDFSCATGG